MELRNVIIIAGSLLLAGSTACGPSDPPPATEPTFVDYSADAEPIAPVAEEDYTAVTLPIPQEGTDTGEAGVTYAAVLGGYFLLRVQEESGRFNYQYDPEDGEWADDDMIHRQCGSTFTQAWVWRITQREEFLVSTRRSLDRLIGMASEQDDGSLRLRDVGATALLTLGTTYLARYSDVTDYDETIERLAQHLESKVQEDGSFSEGGNLAQGQMMMAFGQLHAWSGDDKYLDLLENTARYLADHPDQHNHSKYLALWANEPLAHLYEHRPADWIAEFAYALTDPIVETQHTEVDDDRQEWLGGYESDSNERPSWNTSLRLEAVIDAYRVADMAGDEERAALYEESSLMATEFLMRMQFRHDDVANFAEPELVIGAVPFGLTNTTVRVDVTHHFVNAIMKVVDYLELEDYPGPR